nr:methylsterol monooxygenase 1-like [Lytechinus pictus]
MADILNGDPIIMENITSIATAGGFEYTWRYMTTNYTRFQIATYGSALLHLMSYILIASPSIIFRYIPYMDRFKIQQKPLSGANEMKCFQLLLINQLIIHVPFYLGAHFYCELVNLPFSYETMPSWYITLAQCFGCLVIEDTWHYFSHRLLHHKSIYKYVHKVHHTWQAPHGMVAECVHPIETILLGVGNMWGVLFFGTHFILLWAWMFVRLLEVIDVHSGYNVPLNPLHMFPYYGGAKFHDFHHMNLKGNYAPTFIWWDKIFGTDIQYKEYYRLKKEGDEAQKRK